MGECSKDTAFEMLDYFYEQGGNFIDTAVNYQNEESEMWVGEWMEKRVSGSNVKREMGLVLSREESAGPSVYAS